MAPSTPFAHASEAEMARILDFYAVRWEYEPRTFPIMWNLEGDVVESFAPDFYLPDLDLYLEMTTLRQRLVRKKNRKLRRLRELYPGVNIKLFYARDFRALMLKYGKLALHAGLSGSSGQVALPHGAAVAIGTDAVPAAIAAIVGAEPVSEMDPGPPSAGATAAPPSAPPAGRRRRRPSTTVGADEAIA
jgi:hypoxanthine phosphoribosyltransferase